MEPADDVDCACMRSIWRLFFGVRGSVRRQYAAATFVFMVLILAIIFLFGHLISQSLSRRYLEDILISGRAEAEQIAEEMGGVASLSVFDVLEKRREVMTRTLQGVLERQVWESVEVVDRDGKVIYRSQFQASEELPDGELSDLEVSGTLSDQDVTESENLYSIAVPLGEVGEVVLNVSKGRLAERVTRLRDELLKQTIVVAAVTLLTLSVAFLVVWIMIQRTRRLEQKSREAEELAALGVLAANLAHEIRNPLNSINLNLELLEEDLDSPAADPSDSVIATRKEVGRLAGLVNDFLTFARPTDPCFEKMSAAEFLKEIVDFLKEEARDASVHLRLDPMSCDAQFFGDPGQLKQVMLNLVLNAVQAVEDLPAERRLVELRAEEIDDVRKEVIISVSDRGNGITDDELDKVCTAFYTQRRGGTGLGLAIAKRIVEAHNGRVEFKNLSTLGFVVHVA